MGVAKAQCATQVYKSTQTFSVYHISVSPISGVNFLASVYGVLLVRRKGDKFRSSH